MSFEDVKPSVKPRIFWSPRELWWVCYELGTLVSTGRVGYGVTPSDAYHMWEASP